MKFLDSFKKLFGKKESEGTEKRREQIERSLDAKIKSDMKKEKAKKMTVHDFEKEEKEKEMRRLIEKKRKERLQKEKAAKGSAKKKLKTLSSNF